MGINKRNKAKRNNEKKRAKRKAKFNKTKIKQYCHNKNDRQLPGLSFLKTLTGTSQGSLNRPIPVIDSVSDSSKKTVDKQLNGIQSL